MIELSGGGNLGRFLVFNFILIEGLKVKNIILQQARSLRKISHYGFSLHKLISYSVWISNKDKFSITNRLSRSKKFKISI